MSIFNHQLIEFPPLYPIKSIGEAKPGFRELVAGIVRRQVPTLSSSQVSVRESRGGKWLSVTLVIQAESQTQHEAVYWDLGRHERAAWFNPACQFWCRVSGGVWRWYLARNDVKMFLET